MVDYLKRLFDRFDAKYETFRDDFEAEYFLQKIASKNGYDLDIRFKKKKR